jgi:hypothetical protein
LLQISLNRSALHVAAPWEHTRKRTIEGI